MRCEQGVFFAIFHVCMCPLGRQHARPSKAPQVEHICVIEGHWCRVIVFRRIGRLLNPSRRHYYIFVQFSGYFWVFFRQLCCFLPVMMSSGDPVSQRCAQIDIMTQVCYEGTHFGAQHILDPANNSPWAWHTVAAMLAIWDNPKSRANLATLPFPQPEGFGRRPKDLLDAYDLIPILRHTPVQVRHVPHLPHPIFCAFSAILSNFPHFLPAVHHVQPPRARRTHGPMDHI